MKKLFLILCVLLSCTGCDRTLKQENEDPVYFLFATPLSNHTLWLQAKEGMEDACDELNVVCDWKGPTSIDTNQMDDVVLAGLLQQCDGIITQGVIDPALIQRGNDAGIPFVLVDSGINDSKPLATITKDFTQQAELLLTDIETTLGEDEKLYIGIQVSELTFDLAQEQIKAVEDVFQKHKGGFEITAITESKSDKLHAREEWQKVLNQKMNVALNFAGENAAGCVEAMKLMNYDGDLLVYGVDDMEDTIQWIQEGEIQGSVVTSFYNYGYDAVYLLYEAVVEKKTIEDPVIAAKLQLLKKDSLNEYLDK